ncbi:MAG: thioesterase [Flavobacteriaceae bacterium]|nr:thioesterase [Flavobacteriaceae bacterium]RCL67734.1 MAG: acyl-CoA thioesterase [Cryomorphaceae bacterium]
MLKDEIEFYVRYSETDQMSFVYHGNYVKYFEMGRIAWLNKLGFSYKKMEEDGILLPVIDLKINFKKSALFDDKLTLITTLISIPSYMIEFEYKIKREGSLISSGYTKLIFLNSKTNKPMRCPDQIINALKKV